MMQVKLLAASPLIFDSASEKYLFVPVGVLNIASMLKRQGLEVEVVDSKFVLNEENFDINLIVDEILKGPRVVGISLMVDGLPSIALACELAKKEDPDKIIVLGGSGPTPVAVPLMKRFESIDVVVIGEGEETVAELFPLLCKNAGVSELNKVAGIVYRDNGKVIATKPRPFISNLDSLPFPEFHLIDLKKYNRLSITTARGCSYRCRFCSTSPFWGKKTRYKSAERVVDEMQAAKNKYHIQKLDFSDDTFTQSAAHVERICSRIQKAKLDINWGCLVRVNDLSINMLKTLRTAGCTACGIGIESGSAEVLQSISKGFSVEEAHQAILDADKFFEKIKLFLMWGLPFEKSSDIFRTVTFLGKMFEMISAAEKITLKLSLASPLAQSELYREYRDHIFLDWDLYNNWGGFSGNKAPRIQMAIKEIVQEHPELFSNFYVFQQPDLEMKKKIIKPLLPR